MRTHVDMGLMRYRFPVQHRVSLQLYGQARGLAEISEQDRYVPQGDTVATPPPQHGATIGNPTTTRMANPSGNPLPLAWYQEAPAGTGR